MTKKSAENWFCLSGVLAGIFYILHVVLGTVQYPGYNSLSQAISDLTALDSPSYVIASGLSTIYGALACLCCMIVFLLIRRNENKLFVIGISLYTIMNWVSFIGYSLFPLSGKGFTGTIQDIFHFYVVTIIVVVSSIVSLILLFLSGLKKKENRTVGILAVIALGSMFVGSIGTGIVPKEYFGLFERISVFTIVIFTGVLSVYGFLYRRDET